MSIHQACLIADWGPTTLFLNGAELHANEREELDKRSVAIEPAPVRALDGAVSGLSSIIFGDGWRTAIDALYLAPRSVLASPLAEKLGVAISRLKRHSTWL